VTAYIVRRLLMNLVVLWVVVSVVFVTTNLLPGDFALRQVATNLELQDYSQALREARRILGLDKPLWQRYGEFMGGLLTLDLGRSYETHRSTWAELGERLPSTLELGAMILLFTFLISIPVGIISAIRQNTWLDFLLRGFAIFNVATPAFVIAVLLTLLVLKLDLFRIDVVGRPHFWTDPEAALKLYIIPGLAGGLTSGAGIMRLLRSQMLEVMRNDYVRTAFAKGLREGTVWLRHALKNAMLPVLTVMGFSVAGIVSGQIILENMFNIDGVGRFLYTRLILRDLPPFQGTVVIIAFVVVTVNLLVDIAYAWLDPRIRYAE
jgi:peptide/nickel transport system permease protein